MKPRLYVAAVAALLGLTLAPVAAGDVQLTPVQRLPFPQRAFLVDVGRDADVSHAKLHLFENGAPVGRFTIQPLAASPLDSAVVLAIDASDSMAGRPFKAA